MEIQTFGEKLRNLIKDKYNDEKEVLLKEIVKSNDICRYAIIIRDLDSVISPTIYLEYYFEKFNNGTDIEEIAEDIIKSHNTNMPKGKFDLDCFCDYEKAKDNLFVKLINKSKNKKYLTGVINRDFLDLSMVVYYSLSNISDVRATVTIKHEQLKLWKVNENEVFDIAVKNTKEKLGFIIEDLAQYFPLALEPYNIAECNVDMKEMSGRMYCMTNSAKYFGASCMIQEEKLHEFCEKIKSDLIIIPSSVHEILIVPDKNEFEREGINEIIKDVNIKTLNEGEVLSDHAYYFEKDKGFRQII